MGRLLLWIAKKLIMIMERIKGKNVIASLIVSFVLLSGCHAFCKDAKHPVFEDINVELKDIKQWLNTDTEGTFVWGPVGLEENKEYAKIVQSIRWIAMHGKYFNFATVSEEITNQLKVGQYASLLGWTQSFNGTPHSKDLLNITLDILIAAPDETSRSVAGYCFLTLLDSDIRKKRVSTEEIQKFSSKIEGLKSPISLHELSKKSFQESFFQLLE